MAALYGNYAKDCLTKQSHCAPLRENPAHLAFYEN